MPLRVSYHSHLLKFRFEAGTSRGTMTQHRAFYLTITHSENPDCIGIGEASPLPGLSMDAPDFEPMLQKICGVFNRHELEVYPFNLQLILDQLIDKRLPAIRFGFETALTDYLQGGRRVLFDNDFSRGERALPINGLIWMNSRAVMQQQIEEKLAAGYTTLKLKVGAISFADECALLGGIRERYPPEQVTLRVDANGAWSAEDAPEKLDQLAAFGLHSIEQPIGPRQPDAMAALCQSSPVPIALDEELIGVVDYMDKFKLLKQLNPPYLILKPTLLGGLQACREWIEIANRLKIKWWLTSALESNVGLSAIGQFAGEFQNALPQGLGTGQLYENNIDSPLDVAAGYLRYRPDRPWGTDRILE
jgi:O-succinylbenzoate synthase